MKIPFFVVDVFTSQVFNGAQIAVVPDADTLSDNTKQLIAQELNLTQTAFLLKPENADHDCKLRIYTPTQEIDFASQVILAVAHVISIDSPNRMIDKESPITIELNRHLISGFFAPNNGKAVFTGFSTEVSPVVDRFVPLSHELATILSLPDNNIESKPLTPRLASTGTPYLIIPLKTVEAVHNARFNFKLWSESHAPQTSAQEILLVSRQTTLKTSDFFARLVGPHIGLMDEPPVGAAMPAFAAYLASHDHVRPGRYAFSIERGSQDNRFSLLTLEMDHQNKDTLTVRLGGPSVLSIEGTIDTDQ
ncbi:MAG: PhzF family phenazine biosynthesis protein [Gammaproteobacteria bacterium]|nr:PhzF family phenazine biosynthesis protein [Gammaproteobacteria bacterium]